MTNSEVEQVPYVLGFMFSNDRTKVVLVRKARPAWQAGKLNGVGGHVETGETYPQAMVREFGEETGAHTAEFEWIPFGKLVGPAYIVHLYRACNDKAVELARSRTDEEVRVVETAKLQDGSLNQVPNLVWLIAVAVDFDATALDKNHPFFIEATYKY